MPSAPADELLRSGLAPYRCRKAEAEPRATGLRARPGSVSARVAVRANALRVGRLTGKESQGDGQRHRRWLLTYRIL